MTKWTGVEDEKDIEYNSKEIISQKEIDLLLKNINLTSNAYEFTTIRPPGIITKIRNKIYKTIYNFNTTKRFTIWLKRKLL